MTPNIKRAAWVGLALLVAGWLIAAVGFVVSDGRSFVPDAIRVGVRVFGLLVLITGATMTVFASLGGPTLVMVFGVAVNLAQQAGLIASEATGVFGAGIILLGLLWASRRVRALPA